MQDMKITGMGDLPGGEYGTVTVTGIGKCIGSIHAQSVSVAGVFKSLDAVRIDRLSISGTFKCTGRLDAGEMTVGGIAELLGDAGAERLTVGGMFHAKGARLESSDIKCTGIINAKGQVSTDRLHVTGVINAAEIVGDEIVIHSYHPHLSRFVSTPSKAGFIEATTIDLSGVTAKAVNGTNVTIGPGCSIEALDCNGTLHIDPEAVVKNVTGDYPLV